MDIPAASPNTGSDSPLIELRDVSYTYEGAPRPAISGVTLSVGEGEYVSVVGLNGSGKSTLVRLFNGLRAPGSGSVRVLGLDPAAEGAMHAVRSAVTLVFQSPPDQIVSSVVEEDIAFGPENLGLPRAEIDRRVSAALEAAGLEAERRRPTRFLSAGQQQRLALAGALAMDPRCVVFDEATSMLDPAARTAVLDLMDGLVRRGLAVVHVTHDMGEAARAARVLVMESGRLAFDGSPETFFSRRGSGQPSLAAGFGLEPPHAVRVAEVLGLEPAARESPSELAARIVARGVDVRAPGAVSGCLESGAGSDFRAPGTGRSGVRDTTPGAGRPEVRDTTPGAGAPPFRVEGASYSYLRGTQSEVRALEGVTLDIDRGAVVALVGRTGSGKSTFLQLLNALAAPSAGRVLAFGTDTVSPKADVPRLRMRAPLSIQRPESALFEPYAADDVAFGPRNQGLAGKALVDRVRRWMDDVGLPYEGFRDRSTRSLSGGEKRRLALAGVLALEPEALLLDEPTSALDPASRESVLGILWRIAADGHTVVFATHSMEEAAAADLVAVFAGGRLADVGSPGEIFYERYDPGWKIGRPFACEVASSLAAARVTPSAVAQPLDLDELLAMLGAAGEGRAGRHSGECAETAGTGLGPAPARRRARTAARALARADAARGEESR